MNIHIDYTYSFWLRFQTGALKIIASILSTLIIPFLISYFSASGFISPLHLGIIFVILEIILTVMIWKMDAKRQREKDLGIMRSNIRSATEMIRRLEDQLFPKLYDELKNTTMSAKTRNLNRIEIEKIRFAIAQITEYRDRLLDSYRGMS
ncbi:MAG: hypothetical protein K5798_01825 [Nitrosopumilus sp.]|uniref:hypothetical protein n=1 Tax=Nitrosopumilus sp. TaxID=2024843 RepID=UPI00242D1092|nr:hypothetical protein [Nitrosopumilus sp.]MCV0365990.1 hypothetical protein [Nitrosopumilus sp.]